MEHLEQYKAYLQDVGNIGARHESSRHFYLSVVSALFVFLAMAGPNGLFEAVHGKVLVLVGAFGLAMCVVWVLHMQSFGAIYRAKFGVLRAIEQKHQLFHVFDEEWKLLQADPRYKLLTWIDSVMPVLFAGLFVALMLIK